jgi:hypothetical protein
MVITTGVELACTKVGDHVNNWALVVMANTSTVISVKILFIGKLLKLMIVFINWCYKYVYNLHNIKNNSAEVKPPCLVFHLAYGVGISVVSRQAGCMYLLIFYAVM